MIGHIIVYFITAVLIFAFNVINESYLPFLIDVIFIIITIAGIITVIMLHRAVEVEVDSENSVATRTEKYLVRFTVRNKGYIPLTACKVVTRVRYNGRKIKKTYRKNLCCGNNAEANCDFYISCPSCEMVTVECVKVYIYDYIGLFCIPKKIKKTSTVLVMPNLPPVDIIDKMTYVINDEDGIVYSQERPGDDQTEVFAIREYVPGDSVRKLHWKLTTKSNKLMVKDFSLPIKDNDTVIFDLFQEPKGTKSNRDEVFDLFYGLVYAMTKRGVGFNACFYNNEYVTLRIENQNDIYALFAQIYTIEPYNYDISAAEYFYSSNGNKQNRVFYVTSYLDEHTQGNLSLLADTGKVYYLIPGHVHNSYMPVRFEG